MSWKKEVFSNFKLYAVTDLREESTDLLKKIEQVYQGGADIVQLRSKNLPDAVLFRLGQKIRQIADASHKLFFVNDRADLAIAADADGVHLGQDDLPVAVVRELCAKARKTLWIGKSTHSLEQGLAAVKENPDYIGVGPVFETPTKPGYRPAGLDYVSQVAEKLSIPFVAIGGINRQNLPQVLNAGAKRVAVVRALFDSADPLKEAQYFKETMEGYLYAKSK